MGIAQKVCSESSVRDHKEQQIIGIENYQSSERKDQEKLTTEKSIQRMNSSDSNIDKNKCLKISFFNQCQMISLLKGMSVIKINK